MTVTPPVPFVRVTVKLLEAVPTTPDAGDGAIKDSVGAGAGAEP